MPFSLPPHSAAWQHSEARDGFEVAFLRAEGDGHRVEGHTSAVEDGRAWAVSYLIDLDAQWLTLRARVTSQSAAGRLQLEIDSAGDGRWLVNGHPAPHLDGCLDVDLESSALTNAFPVHRLALEPGRQADAPAAWVRALDLAVERLEQSYRRVLDRDARQAYDYASPALGFECRLIYDESGLVLDYPGIAVRVA